MRDWRGSVCSREAAAEHVRAVAPTILALEQRAAALLVAPTVRGFLGRLVHGHFVVDIFDPVTRDGMMGASCRIIILGEDDAVAADLVYGADLLAVRADDIHMLGDPAERLPL